MYYDLTSSGHIEIYLLPDTDFIGINPDNGAWNVVSRPVIFHLSHSPTDHNAQIRSEFDEILFRHAEESGAKVFEQRKVTSLEFAVPEFKSRPTSAVYKNPDGTIGEISFDFLVDASGRNGIMSTRYLKNRQMNASLKNIACWGYWTGCETYMPGTSRHNAPWFEALTGPPRSCPHSCTHFSSPHFQTRVVGHGSFHYTMVQSRLESSWI